MIKFNRHWLNHAQAFAYFQYTLADASTLSLLLLKNLNFEMGRFYTLLPDDANPDQIHEFRLGGIAKGVRDQVNAIVLNKISTNNRLSCVFDDINDTFKPEYEDALFSSCGLVYEKEIYHLITKKTSSIQNINSCFRISNAMWHSLCVLSEISLTKKADKSLSLKELERVCLNTELIIVGAYDGEGYVFWEKSK